MSFFSRWNVINLFFNSNGGVKWPQEDVVCSDVDQAWESDQKASVGEGEAGKKAKMTPDAGGNLSVRSVRPRAPARTPLRNQAVSRQKIKQ